MSGTTPLPADSGDRDEFADRAPDRVLEQAEDEVEGAAAARENLDDADVENRLGLDPEEQANATEPGATGED